MFLRSNLFSRYLHNFHIHFLDWISGFLVKDAKDGGRKSLNDIKRLDVTLI